MSAVTTTHAIDHSHGEAQVKRIWKAFWILLILTIIELGLGLSIYYIDLEANPSETLILFLKGVITILTLAKAFYIISIFMHLGDEVRNLIMSLGIPALLFIWFIFTFLYEGNSYRNLRNTDAGSRPYIEKVQHQPVPAMKEGEKN
ncbi:cytochrome C oxidase subunit IV family protein [Ginsengibacter hankyongi]|uniref:Cytochrome C oxidase subunit IV family protein n=1 Tax=Ginsengibacter hankyongi TaxID=2607284 RepID=A0A5J5ILP4_9BACT|nr:cytochrome C oxidase subunit IV family protein [Ginsengibacter hankyongi]KAA9042035.1 cytochrome C oxidase subunit IV family protein [Ginsengibacter hankyongi]